MPDLTEVPPKSTALRLSALMKTFEATMTTSGWMNQWEGSDRNKVPS